MRRTRLAAQLLAFAVVAWFAIRALRGQWGAVADAARDLHLAWSWIIAASATMICAYALLVQIWRSMLASVGHDIPYGEAARVWLASSLGRYVPGKVWQLGAMSVMLQRHGVPALTSTTVALFNVLINTVVGFLVALAAGAGASRLPGAAIIAVVVLAAGLALSPVLLPPVARLTTRLLHRPLAILHMPARAIWITAAGSAVQWLLYGAAFRMFARGVLGSAPGAAGAWIAAFAASYLIGFLALFAPGGLVVREYALGQSLVTAGLAAAPQAALLAITSRLWLTVLELGTGLTALAMPASRTSTAPSDSAQDSRGRRIP